MRRARYGASGRRGLVQYRRDGPPLLDAPHVRRITVVPAELGNAASRAMTCASWLARTATTCSLSATRATYPEKDGVYSSAPGRGVAIMVLSTRSVVAAPTYRDPLLPQRGRARSRGTAAKAQWPCGKECRGPPNEAPRVVHNGEPRSLPPPWTPMSGWGLSPEDGAAGGDACDGLAHSPSFRFRPSNQLRAMIS